MSSTSDLVDERAAVDAAISTKSIEVYRYEEDPARGRSPKNRLLKKLQSTDVYLGIFGARYGSPYPEADFDGSIVEWEFDTAMKQKSTEVLAFSNAHKAQKVDSKQQNFLARVGNFTTGVWLKKFADVDQFKIEVRDAVQDWSLQYWEMYIDAPSPNSRIGASAIASLIGAALVGIAAGVFAGPLTIKDALQLIAVVLVCGTCGILITNR